MREKLQRFMIGRYGVDEFNRFLMALALGIMLFNLLIRSHVLNLLVLICLILCYARMLSRNINKRFEENQKFLHYTFYVREAFRKWKFQYQERKKYHIYKCPNCKQKIRVPRGKGKISIHCPKCNTDFIKHS